MDEEAADVEMGSSTAGAGGGCDQCPVCLTMSSEQDPVISGTIVRWAKKADLFCALVHALRCNDLSWKDRTAHPPPVSSKHPDQGQSLRGLDLSAALPYQNCSLTNRGHVRTWT